MAPISDDGIGLGSTIMTLPRGMGGLSSFQIDLTDVNRAESRIPEIVRANPLTLPDLIVEFNMALVRMSNIVSRVELELREAERAVKEAESIALLERAEDLLKAKNIKSSADTREAAVTLDHDVKDARRRYDMLKAISVFLYHKRNAIEMAYYSTKKVAEINSITTAMGAGVINRSRD
jgi:hypothetical protein